MNIVDANGRLVYESKIAAGKSVIALNVSSGIYLMRIFWGEQVLMKKLVK
jgi:hypothetical protein